MLLRRRKIAYTFLFLILTVAFCEYVVYYIVISKCDWPEFETENDEKSNNVLKVLMLADPHLLGPFRGHWFDKLRREWQMERSFQTAISLHKPEIVFVLGDLFDEGQWCDRRQFQEYAQRFFTLFKVPNSVKLYVVPGNHDIGFHYVLSPNKVNRFEKTFSIPSVLLLTLKQSNFILINSMALEGDGCFYCSKAEKKLMTIAEDLKCLKNNTNCKVTGAAMKYSRPIILQHFPMYRKSDSVCNEKDEAPRKIKNVLFKERWDCLSEQASEMIYRELNPRLIMSGHVHHGCHIVHKKDIHEYTLSSFSWRNKNNPTFILAKFTPMNHAIQKCDLPVETHVFIIYSCSVLANIFFIILYVYKEKETSIYGKYRFFNFFILALESTNFCNII